MPMLYETCVIQIMKLELVTGVVSYVDIGLFWTTTSY